MKRIINISIFFFIALILLGFIYFSYYSNNHQIITLLPDSDEIKKKPKDPGGLVVPNSDSLAYGGLKKNRQEKVTFSSEPENPVGVIKRQILDEHVYDSIDKILENIDYYETEYFDSEEQISDNSDCVLPNMMVSKKDEVDNSKIYIPGTDLNVTKAMYINRKIFSNNLNEKFRSGEYKIQLSSSYSQADSKKQWKIIASKHKKILNDAHLIIRKIEGENGRIFFLILAGNYPSLSHAKLVCKKLINSKQNCIVTK